MKTKYRNIIGRCIQFQASGHTSSHYQVPKGEIMYEFYRLTTYHDVHNYISIRTATAGVFFLIRNKK